MNLTMPLHNKQLVSKTTIASRSVFARFNVVLLAGREYAATNVARTAQHRRAGRH
jgi:hypothetical protein